jgi:hypothetical protein
MGVDTPSEVCYPIFLSFKRTNKTKENKRKKRKKVNKKRKERKGLLCMN